MKIYVELVSANTGRVVIHCPNAVDLAQSVGLKNLAS